MLDFFKYIFGFNENSPLLFTQFYFWAFFTIVFAIFSVIGKNKLLLRNTYLFFVSLFFYYKTSGIFILILIFATIFNFFCGRKIYQEMEDEKERKVSNLEYYDPENSTAGRQYLILGLIVNLFTLCYFKYAYLLTEMVNDLFGTTFRVFDAFAFIGNTVTGSNMFDTENILLPVGISFYTFQSISYIMDIYRRRVKPVDNPFDFGFYLTFFPQLVAGPIVRASEFIPQLYQPFFLGRKQFGLAVFWILNGFAKKIILSDYLAVNFADRVFENPTMYSGPENLLALFVYSLQVYADFSGYTDIAIGVAMLMGFYLPQNFNSPYKAPNAGNFWKRWHISLSKWLQDYLYISMGGNRRSSFGTYAVITTISLIGVILSGSIWVAVIVGTVVLIVSIRASLCPDKRKTITSNFNRLNTMLLGGLWHGASWNFMIWGGLNGIGMLVFNNWKKHDIYVKTLIIMIVALTSSVLAFLYGYPVFRIAAVWFGTIFIGTLIRMIYNLNGGKNKYAKLENCWAVLQTFVFITFTRLFFRSGSNLNPAEANQVAWSTAKNMVNQIGGSWNLSLIPDMAVAYANIILLFVLGMIIHWIPANTKRKYRLSFAKLPLPLMAIVTVIIVFVVYQFMSADLQKFIYFQF